MFKNIKTIQDLQKRLLVVFSIILFLLLMILLTNTINAQSVVISEIYNASDVRDEWTELKVIDDNVDMRNWTLSDNNANTNCWQARIRFRNISFWNNMRAGTIIVIWHRPCTSTGASRTYDLDKGDGYIELDATNSTYFDYPDVSTTVCSASVTLASMFTNTPCSSNGGTTLNLAATGDLLQLKNASNIHIHALGYDDTPGTSWTTDVVGNNWSALMRNGGITNGGSVRVCDGGNISAYRGDCSPNCYEYGNTKTSESTSNITLGLPNNNASGTCLTANGNYIRQLREPVFTSQTVTATTATTYPTVALSFTWNSATDPVHTDSTQGYMIVRSSTGIFGTPQDGTTYNIGDAITGGGTVIAKIDNPGTSTISYSDYGANTSSTFCYRVYAYRYKTDNLNGNSYNSARGRAYNTTNYVTVNCVTNPLPIQLTEFNIKKEGNISLIYWTTQTETNNDYFIVERSIDGKIFEEISKIKGAGNSNQTINYQITDYQPYYGINYYRLKQVDFDGTYSYSEIKALTFEDKALSGLYFYDNYLYISSNESLYNTTIEIYDLRGRLILMKNINTDNKEEKIEIPYNLENGVYFASIRSTEFQKSFKFVVNK